MRSQQSFSSMKARAAARSPTTPRRRAPSRQAAAPAAVRSPAATAPS